MLAIGHQLYGEPFVTIPVLFHGYVLLTIPAFVARVGAVACLSRGIGLLVQLFAFRLADAPEDAGELVEVA